MIADGGGNCNDRDGGEFLRFSEFLKKQIQNQCQQSGVLILLTVPGNEQQEQNDEKIPGIKMAGQQIFQKSAHTAVARWRGRLGWRLLMRRLSGGRWSGWRRRLRWKRCDTAAVGSVRLGDITVVHDITCLSVGIDRPGTKKRRQAGQALQLAWLFPVFRSADGSDKG